MNYVVEMYLHLTEKVIHDLYVYAHRFIEHTVKSQFEPLKGLKYFLASNIL